MRDRWKGVDPRLYFITDSGLCARAGRDVAATVAAAVAGGAGMVQVRDKTLDGAAFYRLSRAVLDAVATVTKGTGRRVPVVVNDRVDVAERLLGEGADIHVHVGQDDMPVAQVRERLGPQPLIGLSAATPARLAAAQADGHADLVGIGPVFATATKSDAGPALGVARLRALVSQAELPAFAIGGIDRERAEALRATGVTGICVVSAICLARDPAAEARAILQAFGDPHAPPATPPDEERLH